jgi:hypothetical protein
MTSKNKSLTFDAMNDRIVECPHCGSRRCEDWGEAINVMGGLSDNTKNSDTNFRNVADRYGLTDMNNKDGQAVKRAAPRVQPQRNEPTVKVGGIDVPVSMASGAGCINLPGMAQKIPQSQTVRQAPKSDMMRKMTRAVAEHKA